MDLIHALRKLHADAVLIDGQGKAWTAEDLEYTLLDQRNAHWNRQPVQLLQDGIYRVDAKGQPGDRLYFLSEEVAVKA